METLINMVMEGKFGQVDQEERKTLEDLKYEYCHHKFEQIFLKGDDE